MAPKLVVVGQGYVGLPIAMRAVEVGYDVVGLDIDKSGSSGCNPGSPTSRTCRPGLRRRSPGSVPSDARLSARAASTSP